MAGMRKMRRGEFARRLQETAAERDTAYVFFLGAGCSRTSGIPTAGELVTDNWLPRLKRLTSPGAIGDEWIADEIQDWDPQNPAGSYGAVIERLFLTSDDRQREIEVLCEGKFPGFGYAVVAALMARSGGCFSVALTTNFDDLLADALYLFTAARPLVIHHESLATFIRPTRSRPIIVKLHGDNRLSPMNTTSETELLNQQLRQHVPSLLHDRGLIIMGYGGNDEGIARFFKELPPQALPRGIYWVSKREPGKAIRDWLDEREAAWVEEADFDETMLLLRDSFGMDHPSQRRINDVFDQYRDTYERLAATIVARPSGSNDTVQLKAAVHRADEAAQGSWWRVYLEAERLFDSDLGAADAAFRDGIERFPNSPELLDAYAVFLTDKLNENDRAEEIFESALAVDPENTRTLGNYAVFLGRRGLDRAEEMYEKAVATNDVANLRNYASFLSDKQGLLDRAEEIYERAILADPQHAGSLSSYAAFLAEDRGDRDRAEEMYKRAVAADPQHVGSLSSYAAFLAEDRGDLDHAEEMYERAVAADPQHAGNLGSYAVFLSRDRGDLDRAEEMYERAIAVDPQHANNIGNYALFLSRDRGDLDRAEEMYERAIAVDPQYVDNIGRYAVFLAEDRGDLDRAEEMYERASKVDPPSARVLSGYAVFLTLVAENYDHARSMFDRALAVDETETSVIANYAALLFGIGEVKEAEALAIRAEAIPTLSRQFRLALAFNRYINGVADQRDSALETVAMLLRKGIRCKRWSFALNLNRALNCREIDGKFADALSKVVTGDCRLDTLIDYPEFASFPRPPDD